MEISDLKVLIPENEIATAVKQVASKINYDYNSEEVVVICILKGSAIFTAELVKHLTFPVVLDFMQVSSYGSSTVSSGKISLHLDISESIVGRNVLIVEDIVDSGLTLSWLKSYLAKSQPKSLKICTLLDKNKCRQSDITVDYTCFDIDDEFVVGYGLDLDGRFRNLPYIATINK